jgi:hypothetical protein
MLSPAATPLDGTLTVIDELKALVRARVPNTLTKLAASVASGCVRTTRIAAVPKNLANRTPEVVARIVCSFFRRLTGSSGATVRASTTFVGVWDHQTSPGA